MRLSNYSTRRTSHHRRTDERKKQVAGRLVKRLVDSGSAHVPGHPEYDKYTFDHEAHVDAKVAGCLQSNLLQTPFALQDRCGGRESFAGIWPALF